MALLRNILRLPNMAMILLLRMYQHTLSPDHGPLRHLYKYGVCRHEETCSNFAIKQFREKSFPIALVRSANRVLHCGPWTKTSDKKLKKIIAKL